MEINLQIALNEAELFYKINSPLQVIALHRTATCFTIKCYDPLCNFDCTNSCDLELGETIYSKYPMAIEITKEQFIEICDPLEPAGKKNREYI